MTTLTEAERRALKVARYTGPPNTLEDDPQQDQIEAVVEAIIAARLASVEAQIAAQESCASPAGECYRDHDGCYVAESLRIARAVLGSDAHTEQKGAGR